MCFDRLKEAFCGTPVLKLPDFTKPFVVDSSALFYVVEIGLLQPYDDKLHAVAYFSKK